ncbi:hypothetical protein [Candidatus Protochlamydia sp. R18]|uniref:hypothetical protein n=1 Tax=Candidatus Protochlamydia sp. R18 TaxID=1353977 RepID=UPI0005A78C1F|nr:hypothetical protein [Candidatus Protochlamydia sp. R18]
MNFNISFDFLNGFCQNSLKDRTKHQTFFKGHLISFVSQTSKYTRNNYLPILATIITSIATTELVLFVSRSISKFSQFYPDRLMETEKNMVAFLTFPILGGMIIGLNYAVFQALRLPLSPLVSTAVSAATIGIYLLIKTKFLTLY